MDETQHQIALLLNRLVLASMARGRQAVEPVSEEDRITEAQIDAIEDCVKAKVAEAISRHVEGSVPQGVLDGVTMAGARAYWALKDLEARHEALRVAVMTAVSNPHWKWPEARVALRDALNADTRASLRSSGTEK